MAVTRGDLNLARLLVEKGADVDARSELGLTPLQMAAARGNLSVVELLLKHGANINAVNKKGETALAVALYLGNADVAKELIRRYAAVGGLEDAIRELPGDLLRDRREALQIILDDPKFGLPTLPKDLLKLIIE